MDEDDLAEFLAGLDEEGEFRPLELHSGRLLNQLSHAQIEAAGNLLSKAARSLSGGDTERAEKLIDRAAQMPYDPREEASPGVMAASVLVTIIISDQFEESEPGDLAWLDVVLGAHPDLDATGRAEVASVVHGFVLQDRVYSVTPAEARRIRKHFGDAPLNADLGDGPDSTTEQRRDIIRSLVTAAAALSDAYDAVNRHIPRD